MIFGWGNGGFGGFGGGNNGGAMGSYATQADLQRGFDTQSITDKLNALSNGMCDSFYTQNTNILNGFAGVQNSLCQTTANLSNAITTNGYETRDAISTLGYNLQNCCCGLERSIDSTNFNLATNTCTITNAINQSTRDIVDNQNCNYRALHDEIVANRIEDKNAQIAAQQNEINTLRLQASQERQNNYLVNTLRPTPIPSFPASSLYGFYGNNSCGCGCGV